MQSTSYEVRNSISKTRTKGIAVPSHGVYSVDGEGISVYGAGYSSVWYTEESEESGRKS
jgi:hypothetical protein